MSVSRSPSRRTTPTSRSVALPAWCPCRSLTDLKRSRSTKTREKGRPYRSLRITSASRTRFRWRELKSPVCSSTTVSSRMRSKAWAFSMAMAAWSARAWTVSRSSGVSSRSPRPLTTSITPSVRPLETSGTAMRLPETWPESASYCGANRGSRGASWTRTGWRSRATHPASPSPTGRRSEAIRSLPGPVATSKRSSRAASSSSSREKRVALTRSCARPITSRRTSGRSRVDVSARPISLSACSSSTVRFSSRSRSWGSILTRGSNVAPEPSTMPAPHLTLASASPRRRELLERLGFRLAIQPAETDETPLPGEPPREYVLRVAREKARAVRGDAVLAADTAVVLGSTILGKPRDADDARRMLRHLSGARHEVLTGVCVLRGADEHSAVVTAEVQLDRLSDAQIDWYVATGEPLDKAGAYAIQGIAGAFVREMRGSVSNVIGLPLAETLALLRAAGVRLPWEG